LRKSNYGVAAEFASLFLWICVIWGHSFMSPALSSAESGWVEELLRLILPFELPFPVRKMAHFTVFAVLGVLAQLAFRHVFGFNLQCTANVLFAGLLVAVTDEFIQSFTGRGPMVSDVVLDFSGCIVGTCLCVAALLFWRRRLSSGKKNS